jgi:DNA (cytosine-5)-methyltransferase 1
MAIVAFDLFCGCGGVTHGLRKAGIEVPFGIDFDEDCRLTYSQNNPGSRFINKDIKQLSSNELLSWAPSLEKTDLLLLAACAPCQPFSSHNRSSNKASDRAMLCEVERFVRELLPDFVLLENVGGIRNVRGFSAYRRLRKTLQTLGYTVDPRVIDAQFYGVPQSRKRLVILASRYPALSWPKETHGFSENLPDPITVREAISGYPELRAGEQHPTLNAHVAAQLSPKNLERLRNTSVDGGGRSEWPKKFILDCHKTHDGHPDVYGRLKWDSIAPTLTTKCTSISNGRFGHPEQHRAISAREAAALQSFNDGYMFYGGLRSLSRQIGNAVPPRLAEQFARSIGTMAQVVSKRKNDGWRKLLGAKPRVKSAQSSQARYHAPS